RASDAPLFAGDDDALNRMTSDDKEIRMATGNGTDNGHASPQNDWTDVYHTGPGTLAGRFFRMFWHPIARSEDLPSGRARPARFASEDLTLYRGENGPHLLAFRCAH